MATGRTAERRGQARDSYLELIHQFPLRPIRNERELGHAIRIIDGLLDRDRLDSGEADYLDVLGDIVSRYETAQYPLGAVSDAEMLAHLLESKGISQSETARATGIASSTLSELQAGKRKFTRGHIMKLASFFNIAPAALFAVKGRK